MKQLISIGTALSVLLLVTPSSVTAQNNPNTPSQNNPNRPNSGDLEKELTSIAESTLRLEVEKRL